MNSEQQTGLVFDVQRFSLDDGPGIRTIVFLKGCPLRCLWCHNPEGLCARPEILYTPDHCTGCGRCAAACDNGCHTIADGVHVFRRENCTACGKCADACLNEALRLAGRRRTVDDVLEEVLLDRPFYEQSGGGLTVSGGEPLLQADFAAALLRAAKESGLNTCVETSGFGSAEALDAVAAQTDLFLFDIKETDAQRHPGCTGVPLAPISANLKRLAERQKPVILRCPIIPGCNDRTDHFAAVAALANEMPNVREIHVEPYHPWGRDKYDQLDRAPGYDRATPPDKEVAEGWATAIRAATDKPVRLL